MVIYKFGFWVVMAIDRFLSERFHIPIHILWCVISACFGASVKVYFPKKSNFNIVAHKF